MFLRSPRCNGQYRNNPKMTNMLQLAISLVVELELNKSPSVTDLKRKALLDATEKPFCENSLNPERHTLDEMRAYMGCFYLSSV